MAYNIKKSSFLFKRPNKIVPYYKLVISWLEFVTDSNNKFVAFNRTRREIS
jgi:hypothetical protein